MDVGYIVVPTTQAMVIVVAGLVREAVTFEVRPTTFDEWKVTLTGGF